MRRILGLVALLGLVTVGAEAQDCQCSISWRPPCLLSGGGTLTGPLLLPDGTAAAPGIAFSSIPNSGFFLSPTLKHLSIATYGDSPLGFTPTSMSLGSAYAIGWGSNVTWYGSAPDLTIFRDAANTLALRNGGTAGVPVPQKFNLYGFCDGAACATGYERLEISATSGGSFKLTPAAAGTGAPRPVAIGDGGAKPACDATTRGSFWYDAGGAGVADTFEICSKSAADAYAWRSTSVLIP